MSAALPVAIGPVLMLVGVICWPSPWADPRRPLWWEQVCAASRDRPAAAAEAAVTAHLLAIALRAGLPVATALERVAEESPRDIARDLWAVIGAYERHGDTGAAWAGTPAVWQPVTAALTVAGESGVAPGPLLLAASGAILRRESAAQEAAIGRASVRLVLPLGVALLPAFMCTTVVPLVLLMTRGYLGP